MFSIIGTWRMCYDGLSEARNMLVSGQDCGAAIEHAIMRVEDDPAYVSVGFGGLPARDGHVRLDAGYMDGDTLRYGGVMSCEHIANPIRAARLLCGRKTNCLLSGSGAEEFAISAGLSMRDMRTSSSMQRWREAVSTMKDTALLDAYQGHDTVCVLALDSLGHMAAGTSTSGLFLKELGRVGDSPIIGSGFYCDARYGAAAATGLGEDVMRGCLSYEIVSLMRRGATPQTAAEEALDSLVSRKMALSEDAGSISLIALGKNGAVGAATTLPVFPFVVGNEQGTLLMACRSNGSHMICRAASEAELAEEP